MVEPEEPQQDSIRTWLLIAATVMLLVSAIALVRNNLPHAAGSSVAAIVYVVDTSNSAGTPAHREQQIRSAAAVGHFALEERVPFIVVAVGGRAVDTTVVVHTDPDQLKCDGEIECAAISDAARSALDQRLNSALSLEALPTHVGSPIAEAHADVSRIARRAADGPGGVIVWDSDLEQSSDLVDLQAVEELTPPEAASAVEQVMQSEPFDLADLRVIYLRPGDTAEARPVHREVLWTFASKLCQTAGAVSCEQAVDPTEVIAIIN